MKSLSFWYLLLYEELLCLKNLSNYIIDECLSRNQTKQSQYVDGTYSFPYNFDAAKKFHATFTGILWKVSTTYVLVRWFWSTFCFCLSLPLTVCPNSIIISRCTSIRYLCNRQHLNHPLMFQFDASSFKDTPGRFPLNLINWFASQRHLRIYEWQLLFRPVKRMWGLPLSDLM